MKNKLTLLLVVFISTNSICFAQSAINSTKADSIQVEYLTQQIALTTEESEKFWPVYNNYKGEIRSIRRENNNDPIELEEKVLNIRKKYKDNFKTILGTDDRVNKLFVAEKNFNKMLQKELIKRNIKRQGN